MLNVPFPSGPSEWPSDPLFHAERWIAEGEAVALATVIGTWGSSPRPVGSVMAISQGGRVEGSVSGGCVESAVITAAGEVMDGAPPVTLTYGVASETAWGVGLACGGRLDVFVEAVRTSAAPDGTLPPETVERLTRGLRARENLILARALDGSRHVVASASATDALPQFTDRDTPIRVARIETTPAGEDWFVQKIEPPPRLIIVGAVHIAQALAPMAVRAGYVVDIIDPREGLATPERFPGQTLVTEWPDDALEAARIDASTAVLTLTHDSKLDDPALITALGSPAFYIGALGSRKTQESRLRRLRDAGYDDEVLKTIRGPVGLAIGAIGAEEIAVSILADIIAVRRGSPLGHHPGW